MGACLVLYSLLIQAQTQRMHFRGYWHIGTLCRRCTEAAQKPLTVKYLLNSRGSDQRPSGLHQPPRVQSQRIGEGKKGITSVICEKTVHQLTLDHLGHNSTLTEWRHSNFSAATGVLCSKPTSVCQSAGAESSLHRLQETGLGRLLNGRILALSARHCAAPIWAARSTCICTCKHSLAMGRSLPDHHQGRALATQRSYSGPGQDCALNELFLCFSACFSMGGGGYYFTQGRKHWQSVCAYVHMRLHMCVKI